MTMDGRSRYRILIRSIHPRTRSTSTWEAILELNTKTEDFVELKIKITYCKNFSLILIYPHEL